MNAAFAHGILQYQEEDVFRLQRNFLESLVGRSAGVGQPNLIMWPFFYHVADMVISIVGHMSVKSVNIKKKNI